MSDEKEARNTTSGIEAFKERLKVDRRLQEVGRALKELDADPNKQFIITPNGVKEVSRDSLIVTQPGDVAKSA